MFIYVSDLILILNIMHNANKENILFYYLIAYEVYKILKVKTQLSIYASS